ncbi:unnamed protein product [Ranitomeya imitator]|uniref:Uncharacterized protein n=1 Tax=Ranitomeya imitator TaxID=111125 RepID=A0ABN9MFR2_9NEOB|nr:unnamed protein product [Ranitomeya imitator]
MMSSDLSTLSLRKREEKEADMADKNSGILDSRAVTSGPESKKNNHYILTFGCLSSALCFSALAVSTAAGKQSGDVTALLSGCPALTARPEKHSAEDRQPKFSIGAGENPQKRSDMLRNHGNQGKHRVTKRGPALSYPMFTLVTGDLGIVGRWRAVCVTALQRPNSDAAAIRIVVGIAAASLNVKVTLHNAVDKPRKAEAASYSGKTSRFGRKMIHSLFLINGSGDIFLEKHWKSIVSRSVCDYFFEAQEKAADTENVPPVIPTPHHYLISIYKDKIFFVAVIQSEVTPLFVIEFLHRVADTFQDYFGECSETCLKDNVVIVYELLEEMLDNGFPLATESNILKELIKPPTILRSVVNSLTGSSNMGETLPTGQLSNIPWRRAGVKYTNNEAYFDVIEEVDAIIDKSGSTVFAEIQGVVDACVKTDWDARSHAILHGKNILRC